MSFRTDHKCLLVLANYFITDVPDNLKDLVYKYEYAILAGLPQPRGYLKTLPFKTLMVKTSEDYVVHYLYVCRLIHYDSFKSSSLRRAFPHDTSK